MDMNKYLQCVVCRELKPNPRESKCCHCIVCLECIQKMENPKKCPICKKETSFVENTLVSQLINKKLGDENYSHNMPKRNFSQRVFNLTNKKNDPKKNDPDIGAFKVT